MDHARHSLGALTLDHQAQSLLCEDLVIPLRPKAWQVLMFLWERVGVVVSGRELFDEVWAGVAVTPKTLTNVINELRHALSADPTVCIETRHRRGYRLVVGAVGTPSDDQSSPEREDDAIFVGRERDLQRLTELWKRACSGQRQVVLLGGFAGVGKSTLLERFMAGIRRPGAAGHASGTSALLTRGTCFDRRSDPEPYGPFAEAMEGLVSQADIVPVFHRVAPSWLARMPWLLPATEMALLRQSLLGIGSSRVLREGVQLLEAISEDRPTLLVLEDLHHADAATLDLIAALAQREGPARLLLVASFRTHAGESSVREAIRRLSDIACVTTTTLEGMTALEVRTYLQRRLDNAELSGLLVSAVEAKTGGNALFLKEMVDVLVERQWLADHGRGWVLTVDPGELDALIPDSARALIRQHVEQLPSEDLELLEAASIVGEDFTDKLVAAACGRPIESVSMACRRLAETGHFIRHAGQRLLPDGLPWSVYRFSHDLYRHGIADRLPPARSRACHERLAQAMSLEYADCLAEVAPRLAMHYREAGDWEGQLGALDVAVADAMQRSAPAEAARYLQEGIEVGESRPLVLPTTPMTAQLRAQAQARAERHVVYGLLRIHLYGLVDPSAAEAFDRGLEVAVIGGSVTLWFRAQMGRCGTRSYSGFAGEALAIADTMVEAAEAGHPELLAPAAYHRLIAELRLGNYRDAVDAGRRMHGALPYASPDVPKHFDLRSQGEAIFALALTVAGEGGAAATHRDIAMLALGRRPGAYETANVLDQIGHAALLARDAQVVLEFADKLHAHAVLFGFDVFVDLALSYRAWALCRLGRGGVAEFENVLDRRKRSTQNFYQSLLLACLAELYLTQGEIESAAATVARIVPEPAYDAEIERVRGMVLAATGQRDLALVHLNRARSLAEQQGAGLFERRAAAAIASLN